MKFLSWNISIRIKIENINKKEEWKELAKGGRKNLIAAIKAYRISCKRMPGLKESKDFIENYMWENHII